MRLLGLAALLTACATACPPAPCRAAERRVTAKKVRKLVAQLGHDRWSVREEASRQLAAMGPAVLPLLPDPATQSDLEIANRIRELRPAVYGVFFPASIRKKYPQWPDAFRRDSEGFPGSALATELQKGKCWPAMRALVKWGRNWGAVYWTSRLYASREPRWTGTRWADYVRNWIRSEPDPSGESVGNWLWMGRELIPRRSRTAAAVLAAEMLASRTQAVREAGIALTREAGDRNRTGELLILASSLHRDEARKALLAVAHLRRGGPLPGVRDERLLTLTRKKLKNREPGHKQLASVLPSQLRARLWPLYMEAFGKDLKSGWALIEYEDDRFCSDVGQFAWKTPEDRAALRPFLKSKNTNVRGVAAYLLGRWNDVPSREKRANMLKTDKDPEVLRLAINGITWHKTPYFVPFLRPHLSSKHPKVLAGAAAAVGICGDEKSIPRLIELLKGDSYRVSERAAIGLRHVPRSRVGNPELRKLLKKKLRESGKDWDNDHRECAWLLARICTAGDLPEFEKYDKKVTSSSAYDNALERLGKKERKSPPIDKADHRYLARMTKAGNAEARKRLTELIDSKWGHAQLDLCASLLQLDLGASGTPMLRDMFKKDHCSAEGAAAFVAGRQRRRELVPDIIAALDRSDAGAGTRIWALGEIGDRRAVHVLAKRGLDPRWVVELVDESRAFTGGNNLYYYQGWHATRVALLVDVTSRALEKITGHKIKASTPEELAAGWKKWYAKHGGKIPRAPKPKWLLEIERSLKTKR